MVAFEDIDLSLIKQAFSDTGVNPKLLKVHRSTLYRNADRTTEMQRFIDDGIEHFQQVGACDARAKKAVAVNFT